jgi:Dolichyl-phosphate-mannose-protein mannosyltransferase
MIGTNRWFTEVDDECAIVDWAAHPISRTVRLFFGGTGQHEHPPLYDVFLHFWLRLTAGNMHLLRLPSVLFYITGAWILAKVAKRLGGERSERWLVVIVVLWPFGFHFGRLTTWYSLSFLLISLLTLTYFNFVEQPSLANSLAVLLTSAALVYCNYFGWAFLACLSFDYMIRNRRDFIPALLRITTGAVVLGIAYLPLFRAFHNEAEFGVGRHFSLAGTTVNLFYNVYCVFVSESVAPWFWFLGVPACIAIALCLSLTLWRTPLPAKALLLYFLGLIGALSALGAIIPKRVLIMSPWLVLPVALALGTASNLRTRTALAGVLALITGIGWFGIFARRFYAAPHWVEPWESIAQGAAGIVRQQGVVVGDNPSFFFYLTYLLPTESVTPGSPGFAGLLPDSVRAARVYSTRQWQQAGHPVGHITLLIKGQHFGGSANVTQDAQSWLDSNCNLQIDERMVRDPGSQVKQRYSWILQPEWRIEKRQYICR